MEMDRRQQAELAIELDELVEHMRQIGWLLADKAKDGDEMLIERSGALIGEAGRVRDLARRLREYQP